MTTYLVVHDIPFYEFMSTGNLCNFTAYSGYPDYLVYKVDDNVEYSGYYNNNQTFSFFIDGYGVGVHNISILITSLDGKSAEFYGNFTVYSTAELAIIIIQLNDWVYESIGNELIFNITTKYPGYYQIFIDGILESKFNFTESQRITFLLTNYSVGVHNIIIWARSLNGKEV